MPLSSSGSAMGGTINKTCLELKYFMLKSVCFRVNGGLNWREALGGVGSIYSMITIRHTSILDLLAFPN